MGEQVRVISDESEAFRLQEEHGGWNDKMRKVIHCVLHIYFLHEWYIKKQRAVCFKIKCHTYMVKLEPRHKHQCI